MRTLINEAAKRPGQCYVCHATYPWHSLKPSSTQTTCDSLGGVNGCKPPVAQSTWHWICVPWQCILMVCRIALSFIFVDQFGLSVSTVISVFWIICQLLVLCFLLSVMANSAPWWSSVATPSGHASVQGLCKCTAYERLPWAWLLLPYTSIVKCHLASSINDHLDINKQLRQYFTLS